MPTILLFHHVQGLTPGVTAFADTLRAAGHSVHTPDLLDGRQFASIPDGIAYLQQLGFGTVIARGSEAAGAHAEADVVIGMSMGVLPAQYLAQTREGMRGAVFLHGAVPVREFSPAWPRQVAVQIHAMEGDPEFVASGDIDAARDIVAQAENGEMFLYPGTTHLFTDNSLADYDATAAALVTERVLGLLAKL
jgi:Dienelactone hydrolase and related enzymes